MRKSDIRRYLGEYFKKPKGKWNVVGWIADHWLFPVGQFGLMITSLLVNKVGDLLVMEIFIATVLISVYIFVAKGR